ncbi:MAG: cytidylate kinase-like family protein [Ruminococcus sp.]|nr:cytidylate kinase-like family protein [Ruminococcus sp.]
MKQQFVVTINRSCGSGGSTVARKLASKLGVNIYNKELLDLDGGDFSADRLRQADERVKSSLYARLLKDTYDGVLITEDNPDYEAYQELFRQQADAIRRIAESESCIVVGRCADFVLKDCDNRVSVFITARGHDCVSREMDRLSLTNKEAKNRREKINAYRGAYYLHHTGMVWDAPEHYDLVLSTSEHTYDECADMIAQYLEEILAKDNEIE